MRRYLGILAIVLFAVVPARTALAAADMDDIARVLDALHDAASKADWDRYFGLYTAQATFIGTDASEFWTVEELRGYSAGAPNGWTYVPTERRIDVTPDGNSAYFHELLAHDRLGVTRGTGVLIRTDSGWRIAQYHLTMPVPNALIERVAREINTQSQPLDQP